MTDVEVGGIVIDCQDPQSLAPFWQGVTGFAIEYGDEEWVSLKDPAGRVPSIGLQRVPEPKSVKNRVHIDFYADDQEATATRIEALGARRLWAIDKPDDTFIVLADPEGNEFCIVRRS